MKSMKILAAWFFFLIGYLLNGCFSHNVCNIFLSTLWSSTYIILCLMVENFEFRSKKHLFSVSFVDLGKWKMFLPNRLVGFLDMCNMGTPEVLQKAWKNDDFFRFHSVIVFFFLDYSRWKPKLINHFIHKNMSRSSI